MRIILSERVESELERHFTYGVAKFGRHVAERTFARIRRFLFTSLSAFPYTGVFHSKRDIYEAVIPRTPFVVFYRIDAAADALTAVALFHGAQDRDRDWR
jgi:plasmid stabilization system protein ParE